MSALVHCRLLVVFQNWNTVPVRTSSHGMWPFFGKLAAAKVTARFGGLHKKVLKCCIEDQETFEVLLCTLCFINLITV